MGKNTFDFKKPNTPQEWENYWLWSKERKYLFEIYQNDTLLKYITADDELQALNLIKILEIPATRMRMDHWGKHPWINVYNQSGFGMIETMITIGVMSVVVLGLMQTINNAMLVSQTADTKAALTSLVSSETGVALNQATCTAAITQTSQVYGPAVQFDVLKPGTTLPQYNLAVQNVTYGNATLIDTGSDGSKSYYGTLSLVAASTRPIYGGRTFSPRVIASVYLTVSPTGLIESCGPIAPVLQHDTPPPEPELPQAPDKNVTNACISIGGNLIHGSCVIANHDEPCDNKH